jgi:hypothetical protein
VPSDAWLTLALFALPEPLPVLLALLLLLLPLLPQPATATDKAATITPARSRRLLLRPAASRPAERVTRPSAVIGSSRRI